MTIPRRVLVVDDDPHFTKLMEFRLKQHGLEVITTNNPLDVLSIIKEKQVHLVTLDIDMPGRNGLDILQDIRRSGDFVSVVIITGYDTLFNLINAFQFGADYLVPKPVEDMESLVRLFESCFIRMDDWREAMVKIRHAND